MVLHKNYSYRAKPKFPTLLLCRPIHMIKDWFHLGLKKP